MSLRRIFLVICSIGPFLMALTSIVGYMTSAEVLTKWPTGGTIPMAPSTAVCILALSAAQFVHAVNGETPFKRVAD